LLTSEDPSEVAILLVENYNYDCFGWPSWSAGNFWTLRWFLRLVAAGLKKRRVVESYLVWALTSP
jgi:hypothetical protein